MDELATIILDEFEEFLERNNIFIPCKDKGEQEDRTYNRESARLYGSEYYELLDTIKNVIDNYDDIVKERDKHEHCYECRGYGDDYSIDIDGNLICNCDECCWNGLND